MTINEPQRLRLHNALESQIGGDMAGVLMSSLPPFDWNQVATKDDLQNLPTRDEMNMKFAGTDVKFAGMDVKFAEIRTEIADLRTEMQKGFRVAITTVIGLNIALGSLFLGIAQFLSR
jgi:hypothetical protein